MIFKGVLDGKPYPDHGLTARDWSQIPPQQVRLSAIITTTTVLALDRLLSEDSTFYGDLFPHAVQWNGDLYLEDISVQPETVGFTNQRVKTLHIINAGDETALAVLLGGSVD